MYQKYDISPRQLVEEWLVALRSGEYAQGQFFIRDSDNKFCCLGVLTDVAMKHMRSAHQDNTWSFSEQKQVYSADGCTHTAPYYLLKYIGVACNVSVLTEMNDNQKLSFQDIASHIETNILPRIK